MERRAASPERAERSPPAENSTYSGHGRGRPSLDVSS